MQVKVQDRDFEPEVPEVVQRDEDQTGSHSWALASSTPHAIQIHGSLDYLHAAFLP